MEDELITADTAGEQASSIPAPIAERGGLVTARGTGDGLVIRLDARVEEQSLKSALTDFLASRREFLEGNQVALEWVGNKPSDIFVAEISEILASDFNVKVKASRQREDRLVSAPGKPEDPGNPSEIGRDRKIRRERVSPDSTRTPSLFGGMEALGLKGDDVSARSVVFDRTEITGDAMLFDEPDGRLIYATLRSGQKVETEHSVVIFGDVNSGAEVVAGGDIVVLGTLRGVAHAGAYDETGGGRFIFALNMTPTQLRIGSIISRGSSEGRKGAEIARVDGTLIAVEPYQPKNTLIRRRAM